MKEKIPTKKDIIKMKKAETKKDLSKWFFSLPVGTQRFVLKVGMKIMKEQKEES